MRAVVVFESMFGNTKAIAEAVADGLSAFLPVELVDVGDAPAVLPEDVELLVVGGPTHAFGLSRPDTRRTGLQQAGRDMDAARTGLREWLATVRYSLAGTAVATFDTRIRQPHLPGSAARAAERRLRRRGFHVISHAQSFYVAGTAGPLLDGEADRAHRWAERVAILARVEGRRHARPLSPAH
jgi:Flavodoxin